MNALVSDSDSHLEINDMDDFNKWIHIAQTLETIDWALAIQAIVFQEKDLSKNPQEERIRRLTRYNKKNEEILKRFRFQINEFFIPRRIK